MTVNNVELTEETLKKTDQYCADICQGCIDEVKRGEVRVNDPEKYFALQEKHKKMFLAGEGRKSLGYLQKALYIQTGESVPILP